jgi:hypothetical protein
MADAGAVIKEYVFALGWDIDDAADRKFARALKDTDNAVLAVGASLTAAGIAALTFTDKMADSMEKLYFATRRTGTTAAEFQGLQLSIANAGGSAAAAAQSMENLSRYVKSQPGGADLLKSWGVDEKGIKNSATGLEELGRIWQKMSETVEGRNLAEKEAGIVGTDYSTFQALISGKYEEEAAKAKARTEEIRKMFNLTPKDLEDAHKLEDEVRDLVPVFIAAGQKIESDFNAPVSKLIGLLDHALTNIVAFADAIKANGFASVDRTIGKNIHDNMVASGIPESAVDLLFHPWETEKNWATNTVPKALGMRGKSTDGMMTSAEEAHSYLTNLGWSPVAAAGIVGNLMQESGVGTNPHMNDDPAHQGMAQWDATRQAEFRHLTGHDLAHATQQEQLWFINWELTHGKRFAATAAALRGAKNTQDASDIVQNGFEVAPGQQTSYRELFSHQIYNDVGGASMPASAGNVAITVHAPVTIHGNADADTIKGAVQGSYSKISADLSRQFQSQ